MVAKAKRHATGVFPLFGKKLTLASIEDWVFSWLDFLLHALSIVVKRILNVCQPVTKVVLSRKPYTPGVSIKDVRANRIKLEFAPRSSSPFNMDEYEVEFCEGTLDLEDKQWKSIGTMDLDFRTVARLKAGTQYCFRVRARNYRGNSGWSPVLSGATKKDPVEGGSQEQGFTWTQNATEVSYVMLAPAGLSKKNFKLDLDAHKLSARMTQDGEETVLLEGQLPHAVKKLSNGSYWELVKDRQKTFLSITLEKENKSVAPKFDYWRSCFVGYHEIDTHKIQSDPADKGIIPGSSLSPAQLAQLGIKQ